MSDKYDYGFNDGLRAAVDLGRSGCSPDEIAGLLPEDPGASDPRGYQDALAELRKLLGTDSIMEVGE